MSNWGYVTIAYTLVWGSLAIYALLLARRVAQARALNHTLRESLDRNTRFVEEDAAACDTPPAR